MYDKEDVHSLPHTFFSCNNRNLTNGGHVLLAQLQSMPPVIMEVLMIDDWAVHYMEPLIRQTLCPTGINR